MSNSKFKRKGRAKFIMIDGFVKRSAAWQALTPNDRATYLELKWRYDGLNNGRIGLGNRELAEELKSSKDTARRSLDNLIEKGFLRKAKASGFSVKHRAATEWLLTEYRCDVSGHLPTKDFMRWQPENKQQAQQKDTQAHHKDTCPVEIGEIHPHRRRTGTVRPVPGDPQAHQKDTYRSTIGGATDAA